MIPLNFAWYASITCLPFLGDRGLLIHELPPCASMIQVLVTRYLYICGWNEPSQIIFAVPFLRLSASLFPFSGNMVSYSIQKLRISNIISSIVCGVVSSWIISLVDPPNTTLLWNYGYDVAICVKSGSDTVLSGENIAPPLIGKRDFSCILSTCCQYWNWRYPLMLDQIDMVSCRVLVYTKFLASLLFYR